MLALCKKKHTGGTEYLQGDDQNEERARHKIQEIESMRCIDISGFCISSANYK